MSDRNKAVLNGSPSLPLLFLLNQLVLAVILLHGAAFITPKVEIPQLKLETAKKLAPVTFVNVTGLVFNILCLRGVEASYFQVGLYTLRLQLLFVKSRHCRRSLEALSSR